MGFFSGTWDLINKYIVQPFQRLYDVLVGHSIIPDLVKAIVGWFTSLWDTTKKIFTDLYWSRARGTTSGTRSALSGTASGPA